jgi:hypothetical protein
MSVPALGGEMSVEITPITDTDTAAVAHFLHRNLNNRLSASDWIDAMSVPWKTEAPNYGFMLRDGQRVVGVYLAFYSERTVAGRTERFCNLASWSVLPEFRAHSIRLLKALLAQDGYHFTDLAPTGNVIPLNARLKFRFLDTSAVIVPNLPWPTLPRRTKISADPDVIASTLTGAELEFYRDHAQAAAARHIVLMRGGDSCYVMFRRRWWRGLPVFATILHVSNPELFRRATGQLTRHLLVRHRVPITLAELRIVGRRPRYSVPLSHPKALPSRHDSWLSRTYASRYHGTIPPKMYRSPSLEPAQVDDLYSELVCVPRW